MENNKNKRFLIELTFGLAFIIFLLALVLVVLYWPTPTKIIGTVNYNSYNTYNIYNFDPYSRTRTYFIPRYDDYYNDSYFYKRGYQDKFLTEYLIKTEHWKFDSVSQQKVLTGIFGNEFNSYEVKVKNLEYVGGYFKVVFYFEDRYGKTRNEIFTEYIYAREEKRFVFNDVSNKYEFTSWYYEVFPLSKLRYN